MRIRSILIVGLVMTGLAPALVWATDTAYVLSGRFNATDPTAHTVKLYRAGLYLGFTFDELAQSAVEDGHFEFRGTLTTPEMLYLEPEGSAKIPIFVDGGTIEVTIGNDPPDSVRVVGSAIHQRWSEVVRQLAVLDERVRTAEEGTAQELTGAEEARRVWLKEVVGKSSDSMLAPYLTLRYLSSHMDYDELEPLVATFAPELKESLYVRQLTHRVKVLADLRVGSPAPDFASPNPDGEMLRLSDFRGKWVLVDFWASWCGPCRAQNPGLIDLYRSLASESFEIVGVALEFSRERWLGALEKDGLPWPNVSQVKGFDATGPQLYAVRSLPFNVLVDPEGVIAAKEVAPGELRATLDRLRR